MRKRVLIFENANKNILLYSRYNKLVLHISICVIQNLAFLTRKVKLLPKLRKNRSQQFN